ncbi:MAG TPA: acetoacetate--CoA ligase [Bauldia sp.]|nr:acetoacetate--CoA ligase [Bauldia sp.]
MNAGQPTEVPLWRPSRERVAALPLTAFTAEAAKRAGRALPDYAALHAWSIEDRGAFWDLVWDFCGIVGEKGGVALADGERMPGARFFPEARLNYAENLLRRHDDAEAIVFRGEDGRTRRTTWRQLNDEVSRLQQALAAAGVGVGDRVAAYLPNITEAIVAVLATASLGAVWSSASPDFGIDGAVDRFGQIAPKVLIAADGYRYAGKEIDLGDRIRAIVPRLGGVARIIVVPFTGRADGIVASLPDAVTWDNALAPFAAKPVAFTRVPFAQPLFILFSSGTTGMPKCIVHSAGGALIQLMKEHRLHSAISEGDRVFYFTTLGWMMWNWLVTALASGATLLLFDGSPFHPGPEALFDYAAAEGCTLFGTSAKYIDSVKKAGYRPADHHELGALRTIASTGSPLAPESFDFVYDAIKRDVHLASISGGTDIVSCFVLGVPSLPVWRGEIQAAGLGMAVDVFDADGTPLKRGKGELVCKRAFPSMPVAFWNDPDGSRYRAAYFERFPGIWCHGDFAEWTEHGGIVIHGRSDATLNPGGVRIGTAEIYRQVEQVPEVLEALAIGQDFAGDVRVVLFVRLVEGAMLDESLQQRIRAKIRAGASPRHVPAKIVAVADIPRTKSGKIVELAVREVVHGRPVKNVEALANPAALDLFRDLAALAD